MNTIRKIVDEVYDHLATVESYKCLITELSLFRQSLEESESDDFIVDLRYSLEEKRNLISQIINEKRPALSFEAVTLTNLLLSEPDISLFSVVNIKNLTAVLKEKKSEYKLCRLTLALELEKQDLLIIKTRLQNKFNEKLLLEVKIKPNIVGGFLVEFASQIIDASVDTALEDYRASWIKKLNGE